MSHSSLGARLRQRLLSPAAFVFALVLFPLPWIEVHCGSTIITRSGLQLALCGYTERREGRLVCSHLVGSNWSRMSIGIPGCILEFGDHTPFNVATDPDLLAFLNRQQAPPPPAAGTMPPGSGRASPGEMTFVSGERSPLSPPEDRALIPLEVPDQAATTGEAAPLLETDGAIPRAQPPPRITTTGEPSPMRLELLVLLYGVSLFTGAALGLKLPLGLARARGMALCAGIGFLFLAYQVTYYHIIRNEDVHFTCWLYFTCAASTVCVLTTLWEWSRCRRRGPTRPTTVLA